MTFRDGASHVPPPGIAFGIAFLAGDATLLGDGAALHINRIKGPRRAAAHDTAVLTLSGKFLVLLYLVHAVVLCLVASLVVGASLPLKPHELVTDPRIMAHGPPSPAPPMSHRRPQSHPKMQSDCRLERTHSPL